MNNTATNTATCPTVRKQIGKTTYIVRVHLILSILVDTFSSRILNPMLLPSGKRNIVVF